VNELKGKNVNLVMVSIGTPEKGQKLIGKVAWGLRDVDTRYIPCTISQCYFDSFNIGRTS
jgi:hypothetical protein